MIVKVGKEAIGAEHTRLHSLADFHDFEKCYQVRSDFLKNHLLKNILLSRLPEPAVCENDFFSQRILVLPIKMFIIEVQLGLFPSKSQVQSRENKQKSMRGLNDCSKNFFDLPVYIFVLFPFLPLFLNMAARVGREIAN